MRFKVATIVLAVVLIATLVGWHFDRQQFAVTREGRNVAASSNRSASLFGTWHYPSPESNIAGYWETLELNADGTFLKEQKHRIGSTIYRGTYRVNDINGVVSFNVSSKESVSGFIDDEPVVESLDAEIRCFAVIDDLHNLIISDLDPSLHPAYRGADSRGVNISWPVYTSLTGREYLDFISGRNRKIMESLR